MLNTQVAAKDPVSDKILYPDEYSVGETILGTTIERTTLLEQAGFSQTVIEDVIVEYNPAETSKDISHVVLASGLEIASKDLGITPRTNASEFLGLPVTLYVDSASVDEFEKDYDIVEEDSEAKIIFADFLGFTTVKNAGDEGNIKYTVSSRDIPRITLGTETFSGDKYVFAVYTLTEDGWVAEEDISLLENFEYDTKEGYTGANSYGEISYAVNVRNIDGTVINELYLLYKPYTFGQYFTRTMRYQPTVSDESFITIGNYDPEAVVIKNGVATSASWENVDDNYTYFVETVLGSDLIFDQTITSVNKRDGEASRDTKISGGSVRSGDFIFYYYNELDNVIIIGKNCGGLKKGTLKSFSASNETVKIDSTTYEFGFAGQFESDLPTFDDFDFSNDYISNISNDANVEYVAVDGRVIYAQIPLNASGHRVKHNYVITTTKPEIMAELLGMEEDEYARKLTADGVYVSEKGNMTIAVLNTSNGKWGLAEVAQFEYGTYRSSTGMYHDYYDHEEGVWADYAYTTTSGTEVKDGKAKGKTIDMVQALDYYDVFGENFKGYADYAIARDELLDGGMFAVRKNASGVYDLSVMFHPDDYGMINNGKVIDGLYFSDSAPKTNAVKAVRSDTEAARVTINANTVIVVVGRDGTVGVRVGLQGEDNSIVFNGLTEDTPAYFYSASSKLIVLQLPLAVGIDMDTAVTDIDGNPFDIEAWADEPAAGADETYYVGLSNAGVEYERLDDGTYELTVSGLYNLRTMRAVAAIKLKVDDIDETDIDDESLVGKVLYMDAKGNLNISDVDTGEALAKAVNMRYDYSSTDDERYFEITSGIEFVDDSSISVTVGEYELDKKEAIGEINVTVATLDATGLDEEEYDFTNVAYAVPYEEDNDWGVDSVQFSKNKNDLYYVYDLGDLNTTETITEPVAGIFDQYIIDTADEELLVANVDDDYFENAASVAVRLYVCGQFDEDTGVLNMYVLKVVESVENE